MDDSTPELAGIQPSNHTADFVNAFRAGRSLATPASGAGGPLGAVTNALTGRLALADQAQADLAARRADLLGAIGMGLSDVPYAQRPAILAHLAPALEAEGIPAETVTGFDPTDQALKTSINQACAAKALIENS